MQYSSDPCIKGKLSEVVSSSSSLEERLEELGRSQEQGHRDSARDIQRLQGTVAELR